MADIAATSATGAALKAINGASDGVAENNSAYAALGQGDFLKLMITQLQQQDPFEPVDNKEMLAQMAQFSTLAGSTTTNQTLTDISDKLDALIAVQKAAAAAPSTTDTTASGE